MTFCPRSHAVPDSPVARWDGRWKLAALLFASAGTATVRSPAAAAVAFAAALLLAAVARLPWAAVITRLGLVAFAVVPVILIAPLTRNPDVPGWNLGPVRVSEPGLTTAFGVALRALAVGTFALVLLRTAPPARTFAAARCLRVPGVLVQITQLAHRYSFLLAEEARRTRIALRCRGFRAKTDAHTYHTIGQAVGGLLVRGGDRADRVAAAMRCRGFDGTYRTADGFHATPADVLSFLIAAGGTMTVVIVDRIPS
ncbi:MAG: cobalt ECF transporter T component CbiQ [Fimbriiglobus sp.]